MVESLSPRIWVAIRPYARDREHADDLLQDCWLTILNRLDRFKRNDSFAQWAIAVSKNLCVDKLRSANRKRHKEVSLADIGELAGKERDPLDQVRQQRARAVIFAALRRLSARERDAVVLWAVMGHSPNETAEELGLSQSGCRLVLTRALSKMRRMPQMRALLIDWMAED